jgi:hypothetical protein
VAARPEAQARPATVPALIGWTAPAHLRAGFQARPAGGGQLAGGLRDGPFARTPERRRERLVARFWGPLACRAVAPP